MEEIKYSCEVEIENVPVKWLPKIELFYPDLPGFPIMYIHFVLGNKRIYGFPVTFSVSSYNHDNKNCNIKFLFLCNVNISNDESYSYYKKVKQELENRIGLSDPITKDQILESCIDPKYKEFLEKLFDICTNLYGKILPYGHFYEEFYSIVKFVSAFLPKTGRQSEMRMLYNFLSTYGEIINIDHNNLPNWSFMEFFLLPTYQDIKDNDFSQFKKFSELYSSMKKIWDIEYVNHVEIEHHNFKSLEVAWDKNKEKLRENKLLKLEQNSENNFNREDTYQIERLVDAFNRHPWRACYFIWAVFTIKDFDYNLWSKDLFQKFYRKGNQIKGCSEKVVACYLQQGFANKDVIPIDTWIKTFYEYALGINSTKKFFNSFINLGKLERLIWLVSQANKTNIRTYMELLWCQRYGVNNNKKFRGINPLSCYECKLHHCCCGYKSIKTNKLLIKNNDNTQWDNFKDKAKNNNCEFICIMENNIPKKIYKAIYKRNSIDDYYLIDEFSGYLLKEAHSLDLSNDIMTVNEFIELLPEFHYEG